MTPPEPDLPKRRRQILDDETHEAHRFNAHEYFKAREYEDTWLENFIARLVRLVRKIVGKN